MTRFEKANILLKKYNADYILINDSVSTRYFSGFSSSSVILLYSLDKKILFSDFRYKTVAEKFCADGVWTFVETKNKNFLNKLSEFIKKKQTILFQDNHLTVNEFNSLKEKFGSKISFVACGKEISEIFHTKFDDEVNSIKEATRIADFAFAEWQKKLSEGISEFDAARLLEIEMLTKGSEKAAFDTIILFSENSALVHGSPSHERKLKKGDSVLCDFGCVANGFSSDMTRSFAFGKDSPKYREVYDIVLSAQIAGISNAKPKIKAKDLDKIVRDIIKNAGLGDFFGHGVGHSLGLRIHENPAINSKDETLLKEGMIVTIEPGIYLPNEFGIRIEDTVLITEDGCEILTKTPKNLQVL